MITVYELKAIFESLSTCPVSTTSITHQTHNPPATPVADEVRRGAPTDVDVGASFHLLCVTYDAL